MKTVAEAKPPDQCNPWTSTHYWWKSTGLSHTNAFDALETIMSYGKPLCVLYHPTFISKKKKRQDIKKKAALKHLKKILFFHTIY